MVKNNKKIILELSFQKTKHHVLDRILTFNGDTERKEEGGGCFAAS